MHAMQNIARLALCLALQLAASSGAQAGDPSAVVQSIADAPPEIQIQMLRIVLDDVFGTPEELRASFVRACDQLPAGSASAPVSDARSDTKSRPQKNQAKTKSLKLAALCAAPVRSRLIAVLSPRLLRGAPAK